MRTIVALGTALSLAATSTAQISTVSLFENSLFGGAQVNIVLDTLPSHVPISLATFGFEDKATSLQWSLQPNIAVTFYEDSDGSGAQWTIAYNDVRNGFNTNIGPAQNDTWSAVSWQFDDPTITGTVTLYEDSSFGGVDNRLALSNFQENLVHSLYGFEDETTSLTWNLEPNVIVTFYEHANGTGREYTINHTTAFGNTGVLTPNYNDKFSSFRWHTIDPSHGWMHFYTDPGFGGYKLTRYISLTGLGTNSFGVVGYNDQIDCVQWNIPIGTTVLLYDHNPKGGACYSLTGSGQRDISSTVLHDRLSVYEVLDGDFSADMADRNRPYDENCYLSSHNAHVAPGHGWIVFNQDMTVRDQLYYGARTLQLDTLLVGGEIFLVHGSLAATIAQRVPGTTPDKLGDMLSYIDLWMSNHPREVLTLIFENWDGTELGDYLLDSSPIKDQIHVQQQGSWPTLNELVAAGKRYVIFDTKSSPRSSRIPWQWDYGVENDYSSWNNTNARSESLPINGQNRGLFYMNNINALPPSLWPPGTTPNDFGSLINLMAAFPQFPNYVGVDRIREGGQGGADATRYANTNLNAFFANRASFAKFGPANCGGRFLYANNRPIIGSSLSLSLDKAGGNNAFEFLLYGTSDVQAGATPLPVLLPPNFGTGCRLRVSGEIAIGLGLVSYPHNMSVALPANTALIGTDGYFQTLGIDVVTGEFVLSDGGRAHIGAN